MVVEMLLMMWGATPCTTLDPAAKTLLVTVASDPGLEQERLAADRAIRRAVDTPFFDRRVTQLALRREGGEDERAATFVEVSSLVARAETRFRELDTEEALAIIATATARLAPVHQHPGATELLAHAHFLAAAIYLARERPDAARQRLTRAIDLRPDLSPPRHRFAPRVLAELAAVRAAESVRPVGRLEVRVRDQHPAEVFVDGRSRGRTPLSLDAVGAGRHIIRVAAEGYRSWVSTIAIEPQRDVNLDVTLAPDPERRTLENLANDIDRGVPVASTLALLGKRSGAPQIVVAKLRLGHHLDDTGTTTTAVAFVTSGGGRAQSTNLSRHTIGAAFSSAANCSSTTLDDISVAPAILGRVTLGATRPHPVPEPQPLWDRPWFWAVCAFATVATTTAFVAIRTAQGPPEAVRVRLVPRP